VLPSRALRAFVVGNLVRPSNKKGHGSCVEESGLQGHKGPQR
jgi:hypothetical protein